MLIGTKITLSDYNITQCLHWETKASTHAGYQGDLPRADITFPSVTKDRLIFPPSLSRSPVAPVAAARSLHKKHKSDTSTENTVGSLLKDTILLTSL